MFKNTLGHKTIGSVIAAILWIGIVIDTWQVTVAIAVALLLIIALFVPVVIFRQDGLQAYSMNPFSRRGSILYSHINSATIHAGNVHCKLVLHLHNGEQVTLHFLLKNYDMEGLYLKLKEKQVPITSTGIRTTGWAG